MSDDKLPPLTHREIERAVHRLAQLPVDRWRFLSCCSVQTLAIAYLAARPADDDKGGYFDVPECFANRRPADDVADVDVKRAVEVFTATEWSGDPRLNMTTMMNAGKVLLREYLDVRSKLIAAEQYGRRLTQENAARPADDAQDDPFDKIARDCGWHPLAIGETMTVTFHDNRRDPSHRQYRVMRLDPAAQETGTPLPPEENDTSKDT